MASTKHQASQVAYRVVGARPRVAFASGMVDGASKVGYAMPPIVVVMHIDICEGRGVSGGGVGGR